MIQACSLGPFFRAGLSVGLSVLIAGCFGATRIVSPAPQIARESVKNESIRNPYALKIIDEVNDGHTLHVAAQVKASVPIESLPAILRLTTLRSGESVNINYYPVAHGKPVEQSRASNPEETTFSFDLSTPSDNITDYQLEILWGDEARERLEARASESSVLILRNVTVQPSGCQGTSACLGKLRIVAELYNPGVVPIPAATLGIGFIWQPTGQPRPDRDDVPQREQKISLNSLNLAPGQSRPLKLTVNTEIPTQAGGQFRPMLRIVDPSTEKPLS